MRLRSCIGLLVVASIHLAACGPRRLTLPAGPGIPFNEFKPVLDAAMASCRGVRTLTAELALSGRVGAERIRGRVLAGFSDSALRLEGTAPFGGPGFIFVARAGLGDLLLPRRGEIVRQQPPAEILDALTGISLAPDDLRALLTGCVRQSIEPGSARAYGDDWLAVEASDEITIYLRRQNAAGWVIVAGRDPALEIEYAAYAAGRPAIVRVRSAVDGAGSPVDLEIRLSQVEINVELGPDAFEVQVPPGTSTISLDDLRAAGPLGAPQ
jgi:hypothetical protein